MSDLSAVEDGEVIINNRIRFFIRLIIPAGVSFKFVGIRRVIWCFPSVISNYNAPNVWLKLRAKIFSRLLETANVNSRIRCFFKDLLFFFWIKKAISSKRSQLKIDSYQYYFF